MKGIKIAFILTLVLMISCGKKDEKAVFVPVETERQAEEERNDNVIGVQSGIALGNAIIKDREYIADGFSFAPLNEAAKMKIIGVSYPKERARISLDELYHVAVLHYDFEGNVKSGELIVNKRLAKEVTEIFYELYLQKYPIHSIRLIDEFNADDEASMQANNTSCFNYRVMENSKNLSKHAYGAAIDINPRMNPYVTSRGVFPANAREYTYRSKNFKGKIDKNDLAYKLFTKRGWTWGGSWNSVKDYQHFQKDV